MYQSINFLTEVALSSAWCVSAGDVCWWPAARGAGRGAGVVAGTDRAEAGNGRRRHPSPSTMEAARRRGSPRNRYAVAKVRWPLRAVWSAAEADAPRPARRAPRSPHLLCIYRAAQPAQGCRDVDFTTAVDVYLPMRCRHARNVRTHAAAPAAAMPPG
ncbi:unnamed protein product [Chrysodeixis includens]|uniref:Uncharacterized protein n=1 Tax=Chrysodeixis includens TaxID=689277 RepID=A0A9P0FZS0_CHRIL|nr:unnamed protein product [Chrysodeixis includens]